MRGCSSGWGIWRCLRRKLWGLRGCCLVLTEESCSTKYDIYTEKFRRMNESALSTIRRGNEHFLPYFGSVIQHLPSSFPLLFLPPLTPFFKFILLPTFPYFFSTPCLSFFFCFLRYFPSSEHDSFLPPFTFCLPPLLCTPCDMWRIHCIVILITN